MGENLPSKYAVVNGCGYAFRALLSGTLRCYDNGSLSNFYFTVELKVNVSIILKLSFAFLDVLSLSLL